MVIRAPQRNSLLGSYKNVKKYIIFSEAMKLHKSLGPQYCHSDLSSKHIEMSLKVLCYSKYSSVSAPR